jgi:hypothetical protein
MSVRYTATSMTSRRHGSRTHTIHTDTYRPGRQTLQFSSLTQSGLPDGRGHGRITQNRQYKNKSGRGKLPAVKVAVSDKTIFLLLKGILADFLVG